MKMKLSLCLLATGLIFSQARAQSLHDSVEQCGHHLVLKAMEAQFPGFQQQYDKAYLEQVNNKPVAGRKIKITDTAYYTDTIFTVPVVFHVLYNNSAENINDSLIYNQLEVLNQDFRRMNADTGNTRSFFKSRAGDARIQFEIATTDPNGNATTGIIRKSTTRTTFGNLNLTDEMKSSTTGGSDPWNPAKYLNIWICDISISGQDILLGYAFPPYGHPNWTSSSWVSNARQGVVIHYKVMGRNNPLANNGALLLNRKGRVAVHEIGHYLGLRHIWGDAQSAAFGCSVDDYLWDTPNQSRNSNSQCISSQNTCIDAQNDLPDMIENYMDYSTHSCQNMFTKEQIRIMRLSLTAYRTTLPSEIQYVTKSRIYDTVFYDKIHIYANNPEKLAVVELTDANLSENLMLDVYNTAGQKVITDEKLTKNENAISTVALAPGMYIFKVKKPNQQSVKTEKLYINKN